MCLMGLLHLIIHKILDQNTGGPGSQILPTTIDADQFMIWSSRKWLEAISEIISHHLE